MNDIKRSLEIGDLDTALRQIAAEAEADPAQEAAAAAAASYSAGTPSDWAGSAPTTVKAAIDRLAALVKILNSGTGA